MNKKISKMTTDALVKIGTVTGTIFGKMVKRRAIVLPAAALICCLSVGLSLATMFNTTSWLNNIFVPGKVTPKIEEEFEQKTDVIKENVTIKNDGNFPAYVRAMVVYHWVSETDDTVVLSEDPVAGVDYTAEAISSKWQLGADGYYYYESAVDGGASTEPIIKKVTLTPGKTPDGYRLSVDIVTSTIQSNPSDGVLNIWKVKEVKADGTIVAPESVV